MHRFIYADFNATTPPGPAAIAAMTEAFTTWGNPSSAHGIGRKAAELVERARGAVARLAGVEANEVVFTSGGSEANTAAILGSYLLPREEPFRLLTSGVEHSSVRDCAAMLASRGAQVHRVPVHRDGTLDWQAFETALGTFRPHLVSLMAANNETGVLFPTAEIARACAERGVLFHTDAVQALGKIPSGQWNQADFIAVSAHKIHGPKGAGALIVRRGAKLVPTHFGGSQEIKRRGGTEGVVAIAGFGGACTAAPDADALGKLQALRDRFEQALKAEIAGIHFAGEGTARLPGTSNACLPGIASEVLLGALDLEGVCVSAGSACSSGSISPSHVLLELGLTREQAKQCLRFSWGTPTTADDIDTVARLVINHVTRIRARGSRKP
jgi:cysteine desulfurase